MKKYNVHPVVNNHVWVTTDYVNRGKVKRVIAFQIDLPGRWWEDEYNVHVDGCDYQCKTMDEALHRGAYYFHGNNRNEYEFVQTEEEYDNLAM